MADGKPKLTPEGVRAIEEIIGRDKDAQIGVRRDKLIVWEATNKKKYETTVATR